MKGERPCCDLEMTNLTERVGNGMLEVRFPAELFSGPDLTHEVVDGLPARPSLGELFHNPSENGERISMDGRNPSQTHTSLHVVI